jgi:hypothetical protein
MQISAKYGHINYHDPFEDNVHDLGHSARKQKLFIDVGYFMKQCFEKLSNAKFSIFLTTNTHKRILSQRLHV